MFNYLARINTGLVLLALKILFFLATTAFPAHGQSSVLGSADTTVHFPLERDLVIHNLVTGDSARRVFISGLSDQALLIIRPMTILKEKAHEHVVVSLKTHDGLKIKPVFKVKDAQSNQSRNKTGHIISNTGEELFAHITGSTTLDIEIIPHPGLIYQLDIRIIPLPASNTYANQGAKVVCAPVKAFCLFDFSSSIKEEDIVFYEAALHILTDAKAISEIQWSAFSAALPAREVHTNYEKTMLSSLHTDALKPRGQTNLVSSIRDIAHREPIEHLFIFSDFWSNEAAANLDRWEEDFIRFVRIVDSLSRKNIQVSLIPVGAAGRYHFTELVGIQPDNVSRNMNLVRQSIPVLDDNCNETKEAASIFPNPVSNRLYLSLPDVPQKLKIDFYHSSGQLALRQEVTNHSGNPVSIEISYLSAGQYIVVVSNGADIILKEKIAIIH